VLNQWSAEQLPAQEQPREAQQLLLIEGPDHCNASSTLWALTPQPDPNNRLRPPGYYRDPAGTFDSYLVPGAKPFAATTTLPPGAVYVGTMVGLAELWLDPLDLQTNGYVVNTGNHSDVERWTALASLCA
jgi:hypothetical protein